jgi:hypothetical protein
VPGNRHLAVQQPVHEHSYRDFQGEIPEGYGAGTVTRQAAGQVLVTRVGPGEVHFTTASSKYPSRYVLKQTDGKQWLLINTTPTTPITYAKKHYQKVSPARAEEILGQLRPGASVQAKIDGAASLVKLLKDTEEITSYRTSSHADNLGNPLLHTERVLQGRPTRSIPHHLRDSVLRGELFATDSQGQAIRPQALGGLLNATIANSLAAQKENGLKLKQMLFDIQQLGNKPVSADMPYSERLKLVRQVLEHLPSDTYSAPEEATTPEEALALWRQISSGKHPLTREGVVVHHPHGKPSKIKLDEEHDVHIRDIFPGQGKYRGVGAGGFGYSFTPGGPRQGEVGTGLSDELRREMHTDPAAYIGRVARVRAQERFPSGALRAPSLLALHEDLPLAKTALRRLQHMYRVKQAKSGLAMLQRMFRIKKAEDDAEEQRRRCV